MQLPSEKEKPVLVVKGITLSLQTLADLGLISVALIWGITNVVVKVIVTHMPYFTFITPRFLLAALLLCVLYRSRFRAVSGKDLRIGLSTGILLFGGYGFQIIGLKYTTVANASFIGAFSVVLIPFLGSLVYRKSPGLYALISVGLCTLGLFFLTGMRLGGLNLGDGLNLLSALSYSAYVLVIARYAKDIDSIVVTVFQFLAVAALAALGMFACESPSLSLVLDNWFGILYTGAIATALVIPIQIAAQRYASPTRVGLYMLIEPVTATLLAVIALQETLGLERALGIGFILVGLLLAQKKSV